MRMLTMVLGPGCLAGSLVEAEARAPRTEAERQPIRIIIDADTANEIDDFYAIVRALLAPEFQVEGLCSATFGQNPPLINIRASQQFNEEILSHLELSEEVPAPMGASRPMPDKSTPVDSPAARHIIERAHAGGPGDKLWVIATGQCTNLASALLIDPTIEDKVVFAFIDGDYDHGRWGPGLYNWKNDIHAVQAIFESNVEYFHMPAPSVSGTMRMPKSEAEEHLKGRGGIHDYLLDRWETVAPERELWTMWDIALVVAILRPELATTETAGAPIVRGVQDVEQFPDNPRRVTVWTNIYEARMLADFWRVLDEYALLSTEIAGREDTHPGEFLLAPNFPNPFNSETVIGFALPGPMEAELAVLNLLGQRVATLAAGDHAAGVHAVRWDGRGDRGQALASGVYLYRLRGSSGQVETRRLMLAR